MEIKNIVKIISFFRTKIDYCNVCNFRNTLNCFVAKASVPIHYYNFSFNAETFLKKYIYLSTWEYVFIILFKSLMIRSIRREQHVIHQLRLPRKLQTSISSSKIEYSYPLKHFKCYLWNVYKILLFVFILFLTNNYQRHWEILAQIINKSLS